jgi:hypothetical protein
MATGRVPTTANSPLTTKGDLFTYSTAPARLAVGSNGDTIVADSSTSTGLRWTGTPSASNPVLNSAMQVWQRGTTFTISGLTNYTADRWQAYTGAAGMTVTRQTTSDTTNLPNIQYCLRAARDSGNTGTAARSVFQSFESVNSIPFAGKTVTVSFYARKGANFSPTTFLLQLISGTGTDQNIIGGYTGQTDVISQSTTPTTTWARYSYTGTVPTNSTELAPYFSWSPTGTAGAADYLELTGVQIDVGSVALPYRTNAGTIQGELAACKFYCQNINYSLSGKNVYNTLANGSATGATSARITLGLPSPMRIAPTSVTFTASSFVLDNVSSSPTVTGVTINQGGTDTVLLTVDCSAGTFTNKDPVIMYANNNSNANLILSAEL